MGMHGAGLTHLLFMPREAILVPIPTKSRLFETFGAKSEPAATVRFGRFQFFGRKFRKTMRVRVAQGEFGAFQGYHFRNMAK